MYNVYILCTEFRVTFRVRTFRVFEIIFVKEDIRAASFGSVQTKQLNARVTLQIYGLFFIAGPSL